MANDKGLHPAVGDSKPFEGSGKDVGLVKPPIVSVNPVSSNSKQGINSYNDAMVLFPQTYELLTVALIFLAALIPVLISLKDIIKSSLNNRYKD